MRSSSIAILGGAVALVASAAGCRVEVHTQTQFENQPTTKTASKPWNGEPINIVNDGINPLGGTGGVEVKVDSNATTISIEAVAAAHADDDKKADADASIADVLQTITIDEGSTITIHCGHGNAHGTSNVAGSGCKILRVTIPAGSDTKPLDLTVGSGIGDLRVGLADGSNAIPTVKNLRAECTGVGDVKVRAIPIAGATLQIKGSDKVDVGLPSDFSAQQVVLDISEEDDAQKRKARTITTDFPGMETGKPYPAAGATQNAAASLNVKNDGLLDDDTITIHKN
jgi:hypothetical protein